MSKAPSPSAPAKQEEKKPVEKAPEAKAPEVKASEKKKKEEKKAWQRYEVDYNAGKILLKNKLCSRCTAVMAYHANPVARWTCGTCAYTEYVKTETKK